MGTQCVVKLEDGTDEGFDFPIDERKWKFITSKILNVDTGKCGTVVNIRDDGYEKQGIKYGYSKFDVKYDDGTTEKRYSFPIFIDTSGNITDKRWKIMKV
eukprot:UN08710